MGEGRTQVRPTFMTTYTLTHVRLVVYTGVDKKLTRSGINGRGGRPVTTDDLSLLVAETRCAHGRLTLDDAERAGTGDDWIAYLRDPCAGRLVHPRNRVW